jgi:hypothetical protein
MDIARTQKRATSNLNLNDCKRLDSSTFCLKVPINLRYLLSTFPAAQWERQAPSNSKKIASATSCPLRFADITHPQRKNMNLPPDHQNNSRGHAPSPLLPRFICVIYDFFAAQTQV